MSMLVNDTMVVAECDCLIEMLSAYSLAEVVVVLHGHFNDVVI